MKFIFREVVDNLGELGQVVDVKPGFARNYLLPQGLAFVASAGNMKKLEEEQVCVEECVRCDLNEVKRCAS